MGYKATLYSRCLRKVRYRTRREAREAIRYLEATWGRPPGLLKAYACFCGGYHIGAVRCSVRESAPAARTITLFPITH